MDQIAKQTIILASQSPRRRDILKSLNWQFTQISPNFDETSLPYIKEHPDKYVCQLAVQKALSIPQTNAIIISADTIVVCEGKLYCKPNDAQEAFFMLKELCGKQHRVYSAICVRMNSASYCDFESTDVWIKALSDQQIHTFQKKINCLDKAGAYAIQGPGSLICEKLQGCYYNVMGLPIQTLTRVMQQAGLDIWSI